MEVIQAWPPALVLVASALLGLVVGSFLNVVAYRLPIMMERAWRAHLKELKASDVEHPSHSDADTFNLWWPPSACPSCSHKIGALENVPVLSYLWLRGKCASCGEAIPKRYPVVEAAVGVSSLIVAAIFGPSWTALAALFFTWMLIALSLIDLDHQLLPDSMTLPLLWAGILFNMLFSDAAFADLQSSVIGAAAGYLSLWSVYHLFKLATGKEGMGYGDFKLLAAIGAWLGWQILPLVIILSAAVGSLVGVGLIMFKGRSRDIPIPFGPYLAAAGWIAMLAGEDFIAWYMARLS